MTVKSTMANSKGFSTRRVKSVTYQTAGEKWDARLELKNPLEAALRDVAKYARKEEALM